MKDTIVFMRGNSFHHSMTTQATVDFAQSLTFIASMNWYAGRPTTAASTIVRNTYILTTYKIAGVHNCMFSGHPGVRVAVM